MTSFELALNLQATCAVARSFLGPHKVLKCVIDPNSDSKSSIVGSLQAFLLAADGDPTATTLLLEALECQAPGPSDSSGGRYGPGSGSTWLAVLCGLLTGRLLELVEGQGVPYECVRTGLLQAVAECCEAVRGCALELPAVSERWDERHLAPYIADVAALMYDGVDPPCGGLGNEGGEDLGGRDAGCAGGSAGLQTRSSAQSETSPDPILATEKAQAPTFCSDAQPPLPLSTVSPPLSLPPLPPPPPPLPPHLAAPSLRFAAGDRKAESDEEFGWFESFGGGDGGSIVAAAAAPEVTVRGPRLLAGPLRQPLLILTARPAARPSEGTYVQGCLLPVDDTSSDGDSSSSSSSSSGGAVGGADGGLGAILCRGSGADGKYADDVKKPTLDGGNDSDTEGSSGAGKSDGTGGCSGGVDPAEAALLALESEVCWFFGEGELEAERQARRQRRQLLLSMDAGPEALLATGPGNGGTRVTAAAASERPVSDARVAVVSGTRQLVPPMHTMQQQPLQQQASPPVPPVPSQQPRQQQQSLRGSGAGGACDADAEFGWFDELMSSGAPSAAADRAGPSVAPAGNGGHGGGGAPSVPPPPRPPPPTSSEHPLPQVPTEHLRHQGQHQGQRDSTHRAQAAHREAHGSAPLLGGTARQRTSAAGTAGGGGAGGDGGGGGASGPSGNSLRRPGASGAGGGDDDEFGWFASFGSDNNDAGANARVIDASRPAGNECVHRGGGVAEAGGSLPPQPSPPRAPAAYAGEYGEEGGGGGNSSDGTGGCSGGVDPAEAALLTLESEVCWFFGEGGLEAERQARRQRREFIASVQGASGFPAVVRRAGSPTPTLRSPTPPKAAATTATKHSPQMTRQTPRSPAGRCAWPVAGRMEPAGSAVDGDVHAATHRDAVLLARGPTRLPVLHTEAAAAAVGFSHGDAGVNTTAAGAGRRMDPLARLVCSAAAGLAHGRDLEMKLATAALLTLLRPIVRRSAPLAVAAAAEPPPLAAVAAAVRDAAAGLRYERCVLTADLAGRWPAGAAAVLRGVCLPLSSLSADQAALAARFLSDATPPPPAGRTNAPESTGGTSRLLAAVFLHGPLSHIDHATHGSVVLTSAADLQAAAGLEAFARATLARVALHRPDQSPLLLLAGGHIPDDLAAALYELSGGGVLALGGVGVRQLRAAAAAAGVSPAPAAGLAWLGPRHVARRVRVAMVEGGLGLADYRPRGGARDGHVGPGLMLRIAAAPVHEERESQAEVEGGGAAAAGAKLQPAAVAAAPGTVTVVLAHPLTSGLETQAAAFKTCFQRLLAALRSGRVLPGAGAWELAAAEQLDRRAEQLERQASERQTTTACRLVGRPAAAPGGVEAAAEQLGRCAGRLGRRVLAADGLGSGVAVADGVEKAADKAAKAAVEEWEEEGLYAPLCYRAVAEALREVVAVLLQNGGAGYAQALAALAGCARGLRQGDVRALRRLAAVSATTAAAAAVSGGGSGRGAAAGAGDERSQLAAALCTLMEARDPAAAAAAAAATAAEPHACTAEAAAQSAAAVPLVLDELGAREAALRGALRLALLASCVDAVIVNR